MINPSGRAFLDLQTNRHVEYLLFSNRNKVVPGLIGCPGPGISQVHDFKLSGLEDLGAKHYLSLSRARHGGGGGGERGGGEGRQQTAFPRQWTVCGTCRNSEGPGARRGKGEKLWVKGGKKERKTLGKRRGKKITKRESGQIRRRCKKKGAPALW